MQRKVRDRNVEEKRDVRCLEEKERKRERNVEEKRQRGVRGKRQRQRYRSKKNYIEKEEGQIEKMREGVVRKLYQQSLNLFSK